MKLSVTSSTWKLSIKKYTYLDEHSEIYNHNGRSDEQVFSGEKIHWKQECKRKAAGSSEATVRNNELVFEGEGICSELVTDVEESKHA